MNSLLKSPRDTADYYEYKLSNGLQIFIISDKNITRSYVNLMVKVGYFYDTVDGIAHFLEHMLFQGTEKHKQTNSFFNYLAKYNGKSNAYTAHLHTCYHFDVATAGLTHALEIFSEFFTQPLINKECVKKEINAVNSEYLKNLNDDSWRANEILKVASNGVFANFGCGNHETLNISDIHVKVKNFFEKYYSADHMILVVATNENTEKIKNIIDANFSNIKVTQYDKLKINQKILNSPCIVKYIPIEDGEILRLNWELPFYKNPLVSPYDFLNFIMSNRTKNTLHYELHKNKFVTSLTYDIREIINDKCIFCIECTLTDKGFDNVSLIIGTIIENIKLLSIGSIDLNELYIEWCEINVYKFKFDDDLNSGENPIKICELLNIYDINVKFINTINIMCGNYQTILQNLLTVLQNITLKNMVVTIGSKKYELIALQVYKFYDIKHCIEFKEISYTTFLPTMMPKQNTLLSLKQEIISQNETYPILLFDEKNFKTYWQATNK